MTKQTILTKAIEKAIAGGWDLSTLIGQTWIAPEIAAGYIFHTGNDFIFSHDFAKSLWGEFEVGDGETEHIFDGTKHIYRSAKPKKCGWQYHLQQMVIAEDPITYLGEHL